MIAMIEHIFKTIDHQLHVFRFNMQQLPELIWYEVEKFGPLLKKLDSRSLCLVLVALRFCFAKNLVSDRGFQSLSKPILGIAPM